LRGKNIVLRGKEAYEQINILGDDGVPLEYHKRYWKSELIDFVILQQDAFDKVDANCPIERQSYMYYLTLEICEKEYDFDDFNECANFYKSIINIMRQMNYSSFKSEDFNRYLEQLNNLLSNGK
jgi:V/A-type H+-transporting ATPase subunit A